MVLLPEIGVDTLHKVGTLLVATIDTAFERQSGYRVNLGVTDDVLQVPLHGINPVLEIEVVLYCPLGVRVANRRIHIIRCMVVLHCSTKNLIAQFYEIHIFMVLFY